MRHRIRIRVRAFFEKRILRIWNADPDPTKTTGSATMVIVLTLLSTLSSDEKNYNFQIAEFINLSLILSLL